MMYCMRKSACGAGANNRYVNCPDSTSVHLRDGVIFRIIIRSRIGMSSHMIPIRKTRVNCKNGAIRGVKLQMAHPEKLRKNWSSCNNPESTLVLRESLEGPRMEHCHFTDLCRFRDFRSATDLSAQIELPGTECYFATPGSEP